MKNYVIDRDRLGSVLTSLWDDCEDENVQICMSPSNQQITVTLDNTCVACIGVAEIVDEYDIVREIFNK